MTHDEFLSLVRQPETVNAQYIVDLKEMVELYPYFVPARLFLAKALKTSNSIYYESNIKVASLYSPSRRWLYYYLNPEKMLSNEPYQRERTGKSSGGYFDMIDVVQSKGGDTKQSLKNLADRLKSARAMVMSVPLVPKYKEADAEKAVKEIDEIKVVKAIVEIKAVDTVNETKDINEVEESVFFKRIRNIAEEKRETHVSEDYFSSIELEITEFNAKKLITEQKYKDAIVILKQLNLNNPKKSVYFADQIRFLEKVIETSKK